MLNKKLEQIFWYSFAAVGFLFVLMGFVDKSFDVYQKYQNVNIISKGKVDSTENKIAFVEQKSVAEIMSEPKMKFPSIKDLIYSQEAISFLCAIIVFLFILIPIIGLYAILKKDKKYFEWLFKIINFQLSLIFVIFIFTVIEHLINKIF